MRRLGTIDKRSRSDQNYAEAHNNLGSVIGSQGDLDGAIELFSRAVQLDPDYDEAARNLNKALAARGQARQ